MSRKFNPVVGAASAKFLNGIRSGSIFSATVIVSGAIFASTSMARAESSLPVSGDDPLAWLERPVDCALTSEAVESRYGALIKGSAKNSLLAEEFKFVSSETCTGKRFATCKFSWCSGAAKAEAIDGKVKEFAKAQTEVTSRGWAFDGDAEEADELDSPADNLVASAADDLNSRAALRSPELNEQFEPSFVPPKLVLGKNAIPTLPDGAVVKGIRRVNGSFLPVNYEVPEKSFESVAFSPEKSAPEKVEAAPAEVEPAKLVPAKLVEPAPVAAVETEPAKRPAVTEPAVAVEAKLVAPAAVEPVAPPAAVVPAVEAVEPRVVSLVDNAAIALRANAERELLALEKQLRIRNDGRISVRLAEEAKLKTEWKVVEVPGASARASMGGGKRAESTAIVGANTSEYSRSIVPGIGRAPANTVAAAQENALSKFNIAAPQVDRFRHAGPAAVGALPPSAMMPTPGAQAGAIGGQPKMNIGVSVPVEDDYVNPMQNMKVLKATGARQ